MMRIPRPTVFSRAIPALLLVALSIGCRTASDRLDPARARSAPLDDIKAGVSADAGLTPQPAQASLPPLPDPRGLVLYAADGTTISWSELVRRAAESEVVLIGETHGQRLGLALAAALWDDVLRAGGASSTAALSLEFFERDEQTAMDDYLAGLIDEAAFRKATDRSEGNYPEGHRAMVEAAKAAKRPVIASNAPRRYVRLARTDGFDRLSALTPEQQRLFNRPGALTEGRYREEFSRLMGGMGGHDAATTPAASSANASKSADQPPPPAGSEEESRLRAEADAKAKADAENRAKIEGFFRAQNVWDATMADSIVHGLGAGYRPIVHVVGQFHTDFKGGLTERLLSARPGCRALVLSVVDIASSTLRTEDSGRADVVVYVGQ